MTDRLKDIHHQDALFLLRNCFAIPKLLYLLRTSTCFLLDGLLEIFDNTIKLSLISLLNVSLTEDQVLQSSLPINCGGLGLRSAIHLAPSAFIASANGCI